MKNFELCMSPVETYKAPEIPKLGEHNPDLLKKMPSRWQKRAKIITGLGLIGVLALSGCSNAPREIFPDGIVHNLGYTQGSYRGYSEADLLVRLHTGGFGSSFYMVHLTEQEAFGIIRARLEAAGLNFDATSPGYTVDLTNLLSRRDFDKISLDLFDAEKGVAIAYISWLGECRAFMLHESEIAWWVEEAFAEQVPDIIVRAFYDTGRDVDSGGLLGGRLPIPRHPSRRAVRESRTMLVRQLINQADIFIAQLQSEGILERFPDIDVTINGTPFSTGEYPILINNQKMVSALELFKALGMKITNDDNERRRAITATKNNVEVRVNSNGMILININGNREWRQDIPVIAHNDIILVPLQFIADLVGAAIEWDEDTRTINISY